MKKGDEALFNRLDKFRVTNIVRLAKPSTAKKKNKANV